VQEVGKVITKIARKYTKIVIEKDHLQVIPAELLNHLKT